MRAHRQYATPDEVPTTRSIEHPYKPGVFLPVHRRPMRLPNVNYAANECLCFVTFNLAVREPAFRGAVGEIAWRALLEARDFRGFGLHSACLMPDHVHLLLSPSGKGDSIGDIVRTVKQRQQTCVKAGCEVWLTWQDRFYDHVLGRGTDLQEEFDCITWYIRQNPVRAGLVEDWKEYPFVL